MLGEWFRMFADGFEVVFIDPGCLEKATRSLIGSNWWVVKGGLRYFLGNGGYLVADWGRFRLV